MIKFRAEGSAPPRSAEAAAPVLATMADEALADIEGLVRDERGVRLGREGDD